MPPQSTPSQTEPPQPERIVLTTVVRQEEWRSDPAAVRSASRERIRDRAARQGLELVGDPAEELETMAFHERVRITLSADAVPAVTPSGGAR